MMLPGQVLPGWYDYRLVVLSVAISVAASYAALDLAGRVTSARGTLRMLWLCGGATAMGLGIWSMHYVGMLAFQLPVSVQYDWPTVLLSFLAAVAASAIALLVVSGSRMSLFRLSLGGLFMGSAIAGMHYIGMEAMRLPAMCHYSSSIVAISVAVAILISLVALWLAFRFRGEPKSGGWRKALSAVLMGMAVPVMHYTGMAAASFTATATTPGDLSHALSISSLGTASIVVVTFMALGLTILTALIDRRFSAQALELASSEKRHRQILETSFDAFLSMDAAGNIQHWNLQAEKVFGWREAQVLGNSLADKIIPLGSRGAYQAEIARLLASGQPAAATNRFEITAVCRDGREIPAEFTISAIRESATLHFAAFVRDLSEGKRFEQDLREAKEAAETANEAKSTFLATMSHEIRTPMNGIIGMTELVLDTGLSPEQREQLGLVQLSAESLLSIINDILDFSKIEAGKFELEAIPFDLRESLSEALRTLGFRAHQKGIELIADVDPHVPEALLGDPGRLRQILINLVGNAIKFTDHGEIVVRAEEESESHNATLLHFSVRDTGVGVPIEKQGEIFEAFSQADGSMARKYGGTGLGLTICKRLIELMQGRIWLESQPGHGSTFHFTIALGVQDSPLGHASPAAPEALKGLQVLLVDDNFTNRAVLVGMLARWGISPVTAEGARAALGVLNAAKAAGRPFDLILLDGQMPEMDGFALAERIRQDPSSAKAAIMMLTSAGQMGDAAKCRELSISAYLPKPIRQRELLDAICALFAHPLNKETQPLVTRHSLREKRNRCRVLLVEDNLVNQKLASRLLEKRGFAVTVAGDGRLALDELAKASFDIVLMDVQMPNMDGEEATVAIRAREKISGGHVPIIAMTAHALKGDAERLIAAGMDAYVSKPIRTQELFDTIEKLLALRTGQLQCDEKSVQATS